MKKTYWIIALIVLAVAGDRIGGWFLGSIAQESQFRYSRLYNGAAGSDVLFIGNSRGLMFYQPYVEEKTGLQTCNLSYNGMPIELASVLIKDYLDKHKAPRKLILDITMLDKRMDQKLIPGFNLYTPFSGRLSSLLRDSFPNDYCAGKTAHLYRYNSEVFQRALFYWHKSDEDWLLHRVISPTLQKDVAKIDTFNYDYEPAMFVQLNDAVKYARQKGVEVHLVVNPYYPPFSDKIFNLKALTEEVEKTTGLPVRDYSRSVGGTEGFGDYQHLNKNGAKLFLDKLMEDGIIEASDSLGGE